MSVFVLMAGGTGGHLFPAEALAQELIRRGHRVELITDQRTRHLGETFPARSVHVVAAATPNFRRPLRLTGASVTIFAGIVASIGILRRIKPNAVIGFGGYPTFPPFIAASLLGIPGLLHEQNAVLGRANRALARFASALALSFEPTRGTEKFTLPKHLVGNPVRQRVLALKGTPLPPIGRQDGKLRLLVFGGSQGARFLSEVVPGAVTLLPEDLRRRIEVTQQCRQEDLEAAATIYARAEIEAELAAFFPDLPEKMARSHLVIGRAGASTVAELAVIGRGSILVPLPGSLDQDQRANAAILAAAGGAVMLDQATISLHSLASELQGLLAEPKKLATMSVRATQAGRPDAVIRLADLAVGIAGPAKAPPAEGDRP
ncbi:MAG: undecaprenyldiphospho-muramoylpentapeptide beta-N-acetylglucosaminyltransferase [Cucumibacter sp.]